MLVEGIEAAGTVLQLEMSAGLTYKDVTGDITNGNNSATYSKLFDTPKKDFFGAEFTMFARAGDTVPYFRLSIPFGRSSLSGFGGTQATIGIDIFPSMFGTGKK